MSRTKRTGEGETRTRQDGLRSVGNLPWLVLGGGGLKGLAHIGAWRALGEARVQVAGIVGTSIGSLVGALISSGMDWKEMRDLARTLRRQDIVRLNRRAALINGIRQTSLFRGDTLLEYYRGILPEAGWSAMRLPLLVNAVDLATGRTLWFGTGERTDVPLAEALYASSALPVLYPPAEVAGRVLVDGGAQNPLALERAEEAGARGVIGVDVGAGELDDASEVVRQGMIGVQQRLFSIMTYRRRKDLIEQWDGVPLMYVRPRLDGFGTFDFDQIEYFVEEGYRAMSEALSGP